MTRLSRCFHTLEKMEQLGLPLLVHGESTDPGDRRLRPRAGVHRGDARPAARALPRTQGRARAHHHARGGAVRRGHRAERRGDHHRAPPADQPQRALHRRHPAAPLLPAGAQARARTARRWSRRRPRATRSSSSAPTARRTRAAPRKRPAAAPASTPRTPRSSSTPRRSRKPARSTSWRASPACSARSSTACRSTSGTITLVREEWRVAERLRLRRRRAGAAARRRDAFPGSSSSASGLRRACGPGSRRRALAGNASIALAEARQLRTESGSPVRFVPPGAEGRVLRDQGLSRPAGCETRPDNLHDLFNALAWLAFPRTKARINAMHAAEIPREGGHRGRAARPADHLRRGRRDRAVRRPGPAFAAARDLRWKELFWDSARQSRRSMRIVVLGHADAGAGARALAGRSPARRSWCQAGAPIPTPPCTPGSVSSRPAPRRAIMSPLPDLRLSGLAAAGRSVLRGRALLPALRPNA